MLLGCFLNAISASQLCNSFSIFNSLFFFFLLCITELIAWLAVGYLPTEQQTAD